MDPETKKLHESECAWSKLRKGGVPKVCSDAIVIQKMADYLKSVGEKIDEPNNDEAIVEKMKKVTKCESESCVVQYDKFKEFASPYVVEQNLKENFKTKGPAHTTEWLSNFDIDDTLDEIKKAYVDQKFWNIPFQMRDFAKNKPTANSDTHTLNSNLETFDIIAKYKEGYRCFGVVLNIDYSSGSGIHWFCLFVCMRHPDITIEYFNSSGAPPLHEIQAWMTKTKFLLSKEFADRKVSTVIASKEEHQTDNHSCGVYSLYYIISRVTEIPYKYFMDNIVNAKEIKKIRSLMFRSDH